MAFIQPASIPISFQGGLSSKTDEMQVQPGSLLVLENACFDKIGKLNKRYGYDILEKNILGGSLISSASAIDSFNDELNLFNNQNVYTYISSAGSWSNRGTAISLINSNKQIVRTSAAQQLNPDAAYLNNIELFAWEDSRGGIRYSVLDRQTSAYVLSDSLLYLAGAKPKTIAFNGKIYVLYTDGNNNLYFKTVNPSNPNLLTSQHNITADGSPDLVYDAVVLSDKLYIVFTSVTGLRIIEVDSNNDITDEIAVSTETADSVNIQADSLNQIWTVYTTATEVKAAAFTIDSLTELLAPTLLDTVVADEVTSIESVNAGSLHIIYEVFDSNPTKTSLKSCILKSDGSIVTVGTLRSVGLTSKPFRYGKNIYLNVAHESTLQSTYFTCLMTNAPFTIVGKIAASVAGGLKTNTMIAETSEITPGVFMFPNLIKGKFISEDNTSFSLLGVNSTTIDFTNVNKFSSVTQSNNLLFVGGILQSYDGVSATEQNFHLYPENIETTAIPAGGALSAGQYQYKVVYSWTDKFGQIQYSTPSTALTFEADTNDACVLTIPTLRLTAKTNVVIKVYRTQVNQTVFQEVTSELVPLLNDITVDSLTFIDVAADVQIAANAPVYTTGGILENAAPPSCSLISLYQDRVMISGLEDPHLIWFSKNKFDASNYNTIPVEFSASNTIAISQTGGAITALGLMDDKLVIFKKSSIFVISGGGPNDTGGGDQFSPAELVSNSIGCTNPNSVVLTKNGLMFQSDKGIWLLDRGLGAPQYIGMGVDSELKDQIVSSAVVDPNDNLIIFTTYNGSAAIFDYYINQWSTWTNHKAIDGIVFNGVFTFCKADGSVCSQNRTSFSDGGDFIPMKLVTPWLSFAQLQGYQRVFRTFLLGQFKGPHSLVVDVGYNGDPAFTETTTINATAIAGSNVWGTDGYWGESTPWGAVFQPYEFQINFKTQTCTSIRLRISDDQTSDYNEGYSISSLSFEVGVLPGNIRLPKANKVGTI